ncbi:polysaccharide biosynthesis tyrosine autokinase [Anaeromyxobacter diazotrophicus]|uniref:Tyrosine kinase BceF n=1 Tax=Anaeromyxobacter diazotrophicus TaxID=2590199 RepID=A0A7I9VMH9_9BACT|nr:polysaccharide biosynthesis tyrosine autokinase [Anaeromyxobacter diazotrophicus]GEJ57613.1 tyrosine kinase BceF [Anaeromyxobacter diazotrophicus]
MPDPPEPIRLAGAPEPGTSPARGAGLPEPQLLRDEDEGGYVATLFESRYLIAASALAALLAGVAYVLLATPTWKSEATVQIDEKNKTLAGLEDLTTALTDANPADAEIELLRSRSLLGAVVDQLDLAVEAHPRTFPLVGAAARRLHTGPGLAAAPLGLASYAWGGEQLQVAELALGDELMGRWLDLVALGEGRFELRGLGGELLAAGEVGKPAEGAGQRILVERLVARPGTHFRVRARWREAVIDELKERIRVAEQGRKTGVIGLSLSGPDRALVPAILDTLVHSYVQQNVQRKSAEAAKTLQFIEEQLPALKARVDAAESALSRFRQSKGSLDLPAEAQAMLDRSVEVDKTLSDLELQQADLSGRFTGAHPLVAATRQKMERLQAERAALAEKMRALPQQELETARLTRDARSSGELYVLLLNKAQDLRVVKSGTLGNVRVVDGAMRPYEPASPKPLLSCALALALGLVGGVGMAFVRGSLKGGLEDPDAIAALTGLSVYATVPHSDRQAAVARGRPEPGAPAAALAVEDPADGAVEALRRLRTNLQFALTNSRNNVIAIEGPVAAVGKSFVCCNFAHILADAGRRVLLVDADLRRGQLHRAFGGERAPGLSDVLAGEATLATAVRTTKDARLAFLSCGTHRARPSEMLASPRLKSLLEEAARAYDVVLVDTPSVLAVTDAALVARFAGVNLLVLKAGAHPPREIALALKHLKDGGAALRGLVINDAVIGSSRYGRYARYGYQRYEYGGER